MKTLRVMCLALGLFAAALPPVLVAQDAGPDAAATVKARLAQPEVLRGRFAQEKKLAGFNNPLRSDGRFVLARGQGVIWDTLAPFASGMTVTPDRVLSRAADGSNQVEIDARQQPGLAAVNRLLFAVLGGDVAALSERFDLVLDAGEGEQWRLKLTPRPGAVADVLTTVTLEGDRYVRKVHIEERAGDITSIVFDDLTDTPATLSDAEARRFE